MIPSSSPDYSITKPGMSSHLTRHRNKPLRTYGRRAASTPEARSEPVLKKRRTGDEKDEAPSDPAIAVPPPSDAAVEKDLAQKQPPVHRGSILSYFKPVTSSSRSATPSLDSDRPCSAVDSPPSSPPLLPAHPPARTKRRRLRIRAVQLPSSDPPDPPEHEVDGHPPAARKDTEIEAGETRMRVSSTKKGDEQEDRGMARDGQSRRRKSTPMVQTTLNISAQARFSECRICDTVWNPVIPEDARYHARRHAAVLRARRSRSKEEL